MTIAGIGGASAQSLQTISDMRNQLDDLQRQLGSGIKTTTYSGLGLDAGLAVGLRTQLNSISGYQSTISQVGVRLDLMQTALSQFSSVSQQAQGSVIQSQYQLAGANQTQDQKNTVNTIDALVGMLNTQADGRYLFSGSTVDKEPVVSSSSILNGDGLKAGLIQVVNERKQADLGTSGLGRLVVSAPTATSVGIAEDSVSPFGFKLAGAVTSDTDATVSGPAGSPPSLSVNLGATNPSAGDTFKFSFTLPDGSSQDLTLTATTASPPGTGQFTIGATSADTAANLQTAVTQGLGTLANTQLVAASAVQAGNDFFDTDASHPPQRVDGPPFDTATAMRDGTADTEAWYQGDNATTDPRSTAVARADQSLTVSYGARASEQGVSSVIKNLSVFAAVQFSSSDPNGQAQYNALQQRIGAAMNGGPNQQTVADISGQLAGAQIALQNANDRHNDTNTTLQNMLQGIQGADPSTVAAQIMSLQTSLQATLQTTSMLLQTNLLKYLPVG